MAALLDLAPPFFDAAAERARFGARAALLAEQAMLRLELAPGISFQPETAASVEDQVAETLWAEGRTLDSADPEELAEARASFAVLSPRREPGALSVAATLMLGFSDEARPARLDALRGFPEGLELELEDGQRLAPELDRGAAGPEDRLPSVLALRYRIPEGARPVALVSEHGALPGRWASAGLAGWARAF